jgi:hypothetical protein
MGQMNTAVDAAGSRELQTSLRDELVGVGDPSYEMARKVWNGAVDRHPALIAYCTGVADVIAAVRFAREHDLVSVRSGGHHFGRKRALLASLAVTTVCYVFISLALEWQLLLLLAGSCLVCGLSEANITITQSAIADVSGPTDRGRLFGYIWTMTSVSYIVGPILEVWAGDVLWVVGYPPGQLQDPGGGGDAASPCSLLVQAESGCSTLEPFR